MGLFRKLVVLLIVIGLALFAARHFGIIPTGSLALEKIDKKYGIGPGRLSPVTQEEISAFKKEVQSAAMLTPEEKEMQKTRLLLADMQSSLLMFAERRSKFDPLDTPCGPGTEYGAAKAELEKAVSFASAAKDSKAKIKFESVGALSSAYLDETLPSTVSNLNGALDSLKKICNQGQ